MRSHIVQALSCILKAVQHLQLQQKRIRIKLLRVSSVLRHKHPMRRTYQAKLFNAPRKSIRQAIAALESLLAVCQVSGIEVWCLILGAVLLQASM